MKKSDKQAKIKARNARLSFEEMLDRADERLLDAHRLHAFEVRRILALAEADHRAFNKPRKYWKPKPKGDRG